jgi:hypothetical protein
MTTLRQYGRTAAVGMLAAMCSACATTPTTQPGDVRAKDARVENTRGQDGPRHNGERAFDSPDEAMKGLKKACETKDKEALREIFGPRITELKSGDDVQDARNFENFARRLAKASRLVPEDDNTVILHIGVEDHPFPVPLVKVKGKWSFDTEAGLEEILNRRIGENEIKAAAVCRGYVLAQQEYLLADHDGDGVMEYAQRLRSTPGKQDGLFWETAGDEPPSPLGALVAEARTEGYSTRTANDADGPRPYHGYLYKILTRQGSHAPGGKFDYVINGNMVAGFALIAYPVEWGSSGVMTFLVNSNGKVLEKNLGEKTTEIAARIDVYAPDDSWKPSE